MISPIFSHRHPLPFAAAARPLFSGGLPLSGRTLLLAVWVLALTFLIGCVTPTWKTLSASGRATQHAMDSYYDAVTAGTVRTNDVPRISKMYDEFQNVFRAAEAAVEFEPLARADTNVLFRASALLKAIAVARGGK